MALASHASDPAFAPAPFTKEDLAALTVDAIAQARTALDALKTAAAGPSRRLPDDVSELVRELLSREGQLFDHIRALPSLEFTVSKTRVHGDCTWVRCSGRRGIFTSSTSKGSPRAHWRSGGKSSRRSRM